MNLKEKILYYRKNKNILPHEVIKNYESNFEITFAHNSTAIEGNTLTLMETKLLLEDKISIGGKDLREIYEVTNHQKAYEYMKKCIFEDKNLDENIVKDIHQILMENIIAGGIYRSVNVYISGASHEPPNSRDMYEQIKFLYFDLKNKEIIDPIELAAWTHAEFVRIHPFIDGNGRTSRLIMNYQLMKNNLLPVSVPKELKYEYIQALDKYATTRNVSDFKGFIEKLEEAELDRYIQAIKDLKISDRANLGIREKLEVIKKQEVNNNFDLKKDRKKLDFER